MYASGVSERFLRDVVLREDGDFERDLRISGDFERFLDDFLRFELLSGDWRRRSLGDFSLDGDLSSDNLDQFRILFSLPFSLLFSLLFLTGDNDLSRARFSGLFFPISKASLCFTKYSNSFSEP